MTKSRWQNYALWTSVIAQVLLVVQLTGQLFGWFDITEALKEEILLLANGILVVLSTLGIISNPTKPDSKGYNL